MAFKPGRLAEVTVATKALSLFCNTSTLSIKVKTFDVTMFTNSWDAFVSGTAGGSLTLSGAYDPTVTSGPASVLIAQITLNQAGTVTAVLFYPAGNNAGAGTLHTFNALLTDYQEDPKVGSEVPFSVTLQMTGADVITQL